MLKQATIFKDFYISANATNTAVTFEKNGALSVSVKNDNFAQQVQILDSNNNIDFFAYKYITFDDSAVFEITDCIRNGKYVTLFIQYLTNIKGFNIVDDNFRVDAVSVSSLQRLGLDINELLAILGNETEIKTAEYYSNFGAEQEPFVYALKIRLSELPQNLKYKYTGNGNERVEVTETDNNGIVGGAIFNQSINDTEAYPNFIMHCGQFDNAISLLMIIPTNPAGMSIGFNQFELEDEKLTIYNLRGFIGTLSALITDLTLSVELTIITEKSLAAPYGGSGSLQFFQFIKSTDNVYVKLPKEVRTGQYSSRLAWAVRAIGTGELYRCPVFLLCTKANDGIVETLNFIKIPINEYQGNKIVKSIRILGNEIDLSKLRTNYILIKRDCQKMRIYVDIERNVYTDIQTTLEFAKNAYSNYEAYQKSNIELTNSQSLAMLKQQQEQNRTMQTLDSVAKGASSVGNALFAFGIGNISGGVGQLLGGAASVATDEIKYNMKTQNDTANAKLAAAQAHEKARGTITPSTELSGSISTITALSTRIIDSRYYDGGELNIYAIRYIELNNLQLEIIKKYAFENAITDKITDVEQIQKPTWADSYYQVKICNRSAINTRKDLIIFAEDKTT